MKHKLLLLALTFSLVGGMSVAANVHADETIMDELVVTDDEDATTGEGEIYLESEEEINEDLDDFVVNNECTDGEECDLEEALDEGLANEPEVVCANEDEEGCAENEDSEESEEDAEPAMWPVYISCVAIGLTIIIVIILNLSGRKRK